MNAAHLKRFRSSRIPERWQLANKLSEEELFALMVGARALFRLIRLPLSFLLGAVFLVCTEPKVLHPVVTLIVLKLERERIVLLWGLRAKFLQNFPPRLPFL